MGKIALLSHSIGKIAASTAFNRNKSSVNTVVLVKNQKAALTRLYRNNRGVNGIELENYRR